MPLPRTSGSGKNSRLLFLVEVFGFLLVLHYALTVLIKVVYCNLKFSCNVKLRCESEIHVFSMPLKIRHLRDHPTEKEEKMSPASYA